MRRESVLLLVLFAVSLFFGCSSKPAELEKKHQSNHCANLNTDMTDRDDRLRKRVPPRSRPKTPHRRLCVNSKIAKNEEGNFVDCHPFRCRDNACRTKCATDADCANSTGRPRLECQKGECVYFRPKKNSRQYRCIDFKTAKVIGGETIDCYPLRCRDGYCLTMCETSTDCAGSSGPATLAEEGWPLRCNSKNQCVPLPPNEVRIQRK